MVERQDRLAVDGHVGVHVRGQQLHRDPGPVGNDQRPEGQGMRANGGDDDAVHLRADDRSAGGDGIGGGAGGRGQDDPVALHFGHGVAVDREQELDDAGDGPLVDDHVVEGGVGLPLEIDLEQLAAGDDGPAAENMAESFGQEFLLHRRQEPQRAQVEPGHRHLRLDGLAGDGKKGAVPAQNDDQVGAGGDILALAIVRAMQQLGGGLFQDMAHAVLVQEGDGLAQEMDHVLVRLGHDGG